MKNSTKKWLIAAASLVIIGAIMFASVMTSYHWDFSRLNTEQSETTTYEIKEKFSDIKLNIDTADVLFAASNDDTCRVVCVAQKNMKRSADVQDRTLTVNVVDESEWYEHIGIDLSSPKVTVYLSNTEYGSLFIAGVTGDVEIPERFQFDSADVSLDTGNVTLSASVSGSVKIKTNTGGIRVDHTSVNTLDLSTSTGEIVVSDVTCKGDAKADVTTGEVKMRNVTCQNLISDGSTGEVSLKRVTAAEGFSIERSTGDVVLEDSDAAEIFIKTETGDIRGSLLSEKVFISESPAGSIKVPKTTAGGTCEIITATGDIIIEIAD